MGALLVVSARELTRGLEGQQGSKVLDAGSRSEQQSTQQSKQQGHEQLPEQRGESVSHVRACLMLAQGLLHLGAYPPPHWWRLWLCSACTDVMRMSLQDCASVLWVVAAAGGGFAAGERDEMQAVREVLQSVFGRVEVLLGEGGLGSKDSSSSSSSKSRQMQSGKVAGTSVHMRDPANQRLLVNLSASLATFVRRSVCGFVCVRVCVCVRRKRRKELFCMDQYRHPCKMIILSTT